MKQNIDHMLDVIYSPTGAEGNLRTDFVNGAHTVDKAIKDLQRRFDDMEQRNQQQYQATQLQLAMIRSSFNTVTTTISGLEDQMVNTQRKNLSDLKTNKLMLQTKLLFETNPSQRELIAGLLENTEEETKQLESILANTSREFLMILRGPIAN
jgi:hypothetical protein